MVARTFSVALIGLTPLLIEVEVDGIAGIPNLILIGLPNKAIDEAKERITSALINSDVRIRSKRTIVNLAPATIKKSNSAVELAIAIAILKMYGEITNSTDDYLFFGELSLDGSLKAIQGALPLALAAQKLGFTKIVIPASNQNEVKHVSGIKIFIANCLREVMNHLSGVTLMKTVQHIPFSTNNCSTYSFDFQDIIDQHQVKRAIVIALAGGHNLFMIGSPGSGKSMLAQASLSLLPNLTEQEAIEITTIYSICGETPTSGFIEQRPFRAPHHTTSQIGLIGGGSFIKPGEISLAHRGVLFLDEFPEFSKAALESLRQPLENGHITISRAAGSVNFPARFILIAAANPCPCGHAFSQNQVCHCSPQLKLRYLQRISGPILDRIDLHVTVQPVDLSSLHNTTLNTSQNQTSAEFKKAIENARQIQSNRYRQLPFLTNGELTPKLINQFCTITNNGKALLSQASQKLRLSGRSYHRVIKVAKTIADLDQQEIINDHHISESLQYRSQMVSESMH